MDMRDASRLLGISQRAAREYSASRKNCPTEIMRRLESLKPLPIKRKLGPYGSRSVLTPSEFRSTRHAIGLTQEGMRAALGVPFRPAITRMESGNQIISTTTALALIALLRNDNDTRHNERNALVALIEQRIAEHMKNKADSR